MNSFVLSPSHSLFSLSHSAYKMDACTLASCQFGHGTLQNCIQADISPAIGAVVSSNSAQRGSKIRVSHQCLDCAALHASLHSSNRSQQQGSRALKRNKKEQKK